MDKILLYGGSFNPIHNGHLIVARHVAERLGIGQVVLIPSASPPHKLGQRLAPAEERLALCRLVAEDDPQLSVSDWEIGRSGPNYTLLTVEHFRHVVGSERELCWLIGMDSLRELETWYHAEELVDACTIVTAARPGFEAPGASELGRCFSAEQVDRLLAHVVEGPRIDIAGTEIRARVRMGQSIRYLVPEVVRARIEGVGLYGGA